MKKYLFAVSAFLFVIQCAPDGGNKAILKRGPEVERYDDVKQVEGAHHDKAVAIATHDNNHSNLTTALEWTAYKTEAKKAVKGTFTNIDIHQEKTEGSFLETLEGATVRIEGSSVSSGDPVRDENLKKYFFGQFASDITCHFGKFENGKVESHLTLNGKEISKTISYTASENNVQLNITLDIVKDLGLNAAFASISEACKTLHENKTWSEVMISASIKK